MTLQRPVRKLPRPPPQQIRETRGLGKPRCIENHSTSQALNGAIFFSRQYLFKTFSQFCFLLLSPVAWLALLLCLSVPLLCVLSPVIVPAPTPKCLRPDQRSPLCHLAHASMRKAPNVRDKQSTHRGLTQFDKMSSCFCFLLL